MAGLGRKTWAADEILAADDLQGYIQDQVVFVYDSAGARTSGILSPTEGMMSYLKDTNQISVFNGSAWVDIAPDVGTPGTYTKVTTDFKGRVTSGTTLSAGDIPSLDASKTTSGSFDAARIPSLDASKTTSGSFDAARIPSLDGSKITTGNIDVPGSLAGTSIGVKNLVGGFAILLQSNGNASIGGTLNVSNGFGLTGNVFAPTTYNQTNTGRAMFVAADGLYGIGASSIRFKENVVDADLDIEAVKKIAVRHFNYKEDFSKDQSKQLGVIAEELVELGLTDFVYFDEQGIPDGVAYEKLALAVLSLVKVQDERLDELEARLARLEK
jgi:hypothetical protein